MSAGTDNWERPNHGSPFQWRGMAPDADILDIEVASAIDAELLIEVIKVHRMDLSNISYVVSFDGRYDANNQVRDQAIRGDLASGGTPVPPRLQIYSAGNHGITAEKGGEQTGYFSLTKQKKYASEWGMDPLWAGAETQPLAPGDFAPAKLHPGLSLEELPGALVDVVGVEPGYDAGRGLWYADVPLKSGAAYFPFARLALARFQPNAVAGAELSRVVLSDFVQVVPERTATYELLPPGPDAAVTVNVSLKGPAPAELELEPRLRRVFARVERRRDGDLLHDPLGWEPFLTIGLSSKDPSALVQEWAGGMSVPTPVPVPLRVVVLEVEVHDADGVFPDNPLHLFEALDDKTASHQRGGYRVVFADAVVFD